jgi:predicted extracellular nuclease
MNSRTFGAVLAVFLMSTWLTAQTKISGMVKCEKPSQVQNVDVGDKPGHSFSIGQIHCTWTKPMEIEGAHTKEDVVTISNEVNGAKAQGRGFVVATLDSGDKFYARTHGTDKYNKDGSVASSDGTFMFEGGTGKLKKITGTGTFTGKPDPDGNIIYTVTGGYEIK